MPPTAAAGNAEGDRSAVSNQCHRPEQTLLNHFIEEYYPAFTAHLVAHGEESPCYVRFEFED
jgi:hypothetical protein